MLTILDSNQQTQRNLLRDLAGFGLNPQDWSLKPASRHCWLILSKLDPDFTFQGQTRKKGTQISWDQLQLMSL